MEIPRILEIDSDPVNIQTEEEFKIKIKITGINKICYYKNYELEKYTDFLEQTYEDIKEMEVI